MTRVLIVSWMFVRSTPDIGDSVFRKLQFVSASLYSLGHGGDDAQKAMGVIMALLISRGVMHGEADVPLWVVLSRQAAMGLGTLMGGWRIVHTMGSKITRLSPMQGFCAETGGAIIGFGAWRRASAVRWGVAKNIVVAWVITIPAAATLSAAFYWLAALF